MTGGRRGIRIFTNTPMYFNPLCAIKYIMFKFGRRNLTRIAAFILLIAILTVTPIMIAAQAKSPQDTQSNEITVLNVWQIDCFEGGKGSRANYIKTAGEKFKKEYGYYVTVSSLSSVAALENLKAGNVPDLISYGAGMGGLESYLNATAPYSVWCNGGYCLISLGESADFSDVNDQNTIINCGTENNSAACALFLGLEKAQTDKPTGAYVKLIDGKYKYLLGTQRDVFRLRTRNVAYSIKPVTEFNDLYQLISVTTKDKKKVDKAIKFIDYLKGKNEDLTKLGLFCDGKNIYDDDLRAMEGLTYEYKIDFPIGNAIKNDINAAVANCDLKKLKTLIK